MKYIFVLLIALAGTATHAQWEKVAWENATVTSIIKHNGDLYCATGIDGVYRSVDGGATWQTFNEGITAHHFALQGREIIATSTHFLLASDAPWGRTQLFRRPITGGSWQYHSTLMDSSWINDIIQVGTDTLVACAEGFLADSGRTKSGVYISINGGATWERRWNGLPTWISYMKVACHDQNISISFVLIDTTAEYYPPAGIFRSTDLGTTWTLATQGLPDSVIFDNVESNGKTFFADVYRYDVTSYLYEGIYRSTDHGATWVPAMSGIGLGEENAFNFIGVDSFVVVSMTNASYFTKDEGATWEEFLPESQAFYYDAVRLNDIVLFGVGGGVLIPNDPDLTHATDYLYSNDGFLAFYRIAVYAEDNTIYANLAYSGTSEWIARSSDNGETWAYVTIDDESVTMSAAPWDPSNNLMYAGGRNEANGRAAILRSASPYATWTVHATLFPTGYVEAFDVKGDSILAAVARESGVPALYFSSNSGVTWKLLDVPSSSKEAYVSVKFVGDNFLIHDDYRYTYLSTNGGVTWKNPMVNTFAGLSVAVKGEFAVIAGLNFDYSGPGLVLTPDIYVSTDAGETWKRSSSGIPDNLILDQVAIDKERPGILYLSTDPYPFATSENPPQSTIFVSGNNGDNWTKLGDDIPQASRLFIGSEYVFANSLHGLYRHPTVKEDVTDDRNRTKVVASISAYPNPASIQTTLQFNLPIPSRVHVAIHDELGRLVRKIQLGHVAAGEHTEILDIADLASGSYLLRLQSPAVIAECRFTKIR